MILQEGLDHPGQRGDGDQHPGHQRCQEPPVQPSQIAEPLAYLPSGHPAQGGGPVLEGAQQLFVNPEELAGLFLGLVTASVVVAVRMPAAWSSLQVGSATLAAAILFVVLGFSGGAVVDPSPVAFFGAGAVAVCAWILPGISGAFLLLMLGMYPSVLGAVDDGIFGDLVMVAAGAVVGLALFSTILGYLLERHRDTVLAILVGLMAGSLRVLWPWPNGVGVVSRHADKLVSGTGMAWPTAGDMWPPLVLAGVAFVAVLGLDAWSRRT